MFRSIQAGVFFGLKDNRKYGDKLWIDSSVQNKAIMNKYELVYLNYLVKEILVLMNKTDWEYLNEMPK